MRDAYARGQLKVGTSDIQAIRCNVAKVLVDMLQKRMAKGRTEDNPVVRDIVGLLTSKMDALAKVGGGVCHGLVYSWFASLNENRTNLNFDVGSGGWTEARPQIAARAVESQATNSARFLARTSTMGDSAAKSRASGKMAADAGFAEAEVCYATVSRPALEAVLTRVITDDYPRCYRISIKASQGRHSIGLIRRGSQYYLLDPNVGILFYDRMANLVDDLTGVLTATDLDKGYGARSLRVFRAEAKPRPSEPSSDGDVDASIEAMLAQLRAG